MPPFRIQPLPPTTTPTSLISHLFTALSPTESLALTPTSIFFTPCPTYPNSRTAIFTIPHPLPRFFQTLEGGPNRITVTDPDYNQKAREWMTTHGLTVDEEEQVEVDARFAGWTQVSLEVEEEGLVADVIAIHGINGHAFGTWTAKENDSGEEKMWLKDFLAYEFPQCRVLTYGYNADLKSSGEGDLLALTRELVGALEMVRKTETERKRPIIWIGHDIGGILIAQTLITAKFNGRSKGNRALDSLLAATYGALFFDTPHEGIETGSIISKLKADQHDQRIPLIEELSVRSLKRDYYRFIDLCDDIKIWSFHLPVGRKRVKYGHTEPYLTAISEARCVLQLPRKIETRVTIGEDHMSMATFSSERGPEYVYVRQAIESLVEDALEFMEIGFHREQCGV